MFSATCQFCAKNASNWKEVLRSIPSGKIQIIGIALGKNGEDFLKKYELENKFSTVNLLPDKPTQAPAFDVTPQTILVDSAGNVEKVWSGILSKNNFDDLLGAVGAVKSAR